VRHEIAVVEAADPGEPSRRPSAGGAETHARPGVPGVGPRVSALLVSEVARMVSSDRSQIAALVGVAPFNGGLRNTAGPATSARPTPTVGLPCTMDTLVATRHDPVIKTITSILKA
jgi:transposase